MLRTCPDKGAAGQICTKPVDVQQDHCYGCRYGGGVDRRHAAVTRCLADVIFSHSGAKVFIEQEVPAVTRIVNGQREHACMDLGDARAAFCHTLSCFSLSPSLCEVSVPSLREHCRGFSFKLAPALPCGLAVTTLLSMTTSTTPPTLSYSSLLTPTSPQPYLLVSPRWMSS